VSASSHRRAVAPFLLAVGIALVAAACGDDGGAPVACPAPGEAASEACLRAELGVPAEVTRVLILSQSSHLDWDWLRTFDVYYAQQVEKIFTDALDLQLRFHGAERHYYYSIAEMGYLQRFVAQRPDRLAALHAVGNDLRIVGGGITSPDNLLPNGEALLRDYLVGKTWVDAALGLPLRQAWIPDDFGHDAQLPIALAAMGLEAVGFARVPGVDTNHTYGSDPPRPGSLATDLLADGIDFIWQAADGSEVFAHWMPEGYCQGESIDRAVGAIPPDVQTDDPELASAIVRLRAHLAVNGPASPTPYVFVPIGCDFAPPKPRLLDYARAWNQSEYPRSGVWAVAATFDHYAQLVGHHRDALRRRPFDPTPYWTGFYASRPALKTLHEAATRTLLGAEVFAALVDGLDRGDPLTWADGVAGRAAELHAAWETLVPSNHHDYVTGTAPDQTYRDEQVPRLGAALVRAEAARAAALDRLAEAIGAAPAPGEQPVAVFNQLGFARGGLVELDTEVGDAIASVRVAGGGHGPVQRSAEGGVLFAAAAPSFGFDTVYLSGAAPDAAEDDRAEIAAAPDGSALELGNGLLRATLTRAAGWGLTSLVDRAGERELLAAGQIGNALKVYSDQGGLYRFGDEMEGCALTPREDGLPESPLAPEILERGPLRVRVRVQQLFGGQAYEMEYALVRGEPFLRVLARGAAPAGTSVMLEVPLADPVDALVHGTPTHWDRKTLSRARWGVSVEATHDFVVPYGGAAPRLGILHAGVPAWAATPAGVLRGVLWRNARVERCDFYGALGTDAGVHALAYALRVPAGIEPPERGAQLRESLALHAPLLARPVGGRGPWPSRWSLASVAPAPAILTVAKEATAAPEDLVLRLYQPTNAPLPVVVRTAAARRAPVGRVLRLQANTALETPLDAAAAGALHLRGAPERFDLVARGALTTVRITAGQ
jgi:alpha-mannosidase